MERVAFRVLVPSWQWGVYPLGRALGLRYGLDCVIHICMLKSQPAVPQNALYLEAEVFEEAIKLAQSH